MAVTIIYDSNTYTSKTITGTVHPMFIYDQLLGHGDWTFYALDETVISGSNGIADLKSATKTDDAPEWFAKNVKIVSGGSMGLTAGATATGTTIGQNGIEAVSAGYLPATSAYQSVPLYNGSTCRAASAFGTVVSSGGTQAVRCGYASGTQILSGGTQTVNGGICYLNAASSVDKSTYSSSLTGLAEAVTVSSGGLQMVSSGGIASGTVLQSGGTAIAGFGGILKGVIQSGGDIVLSSGGILSEMQVKSGETLHWQGSGGSVTDCTIAKGGLLSVNSVTAEGNIILGTMEVGSNGKTLANYVLGQDLVSSGGVVGYDQILSGGSLVCATSGTVRGATVLSGGEAVVSSGGTAELIKVRTGGELTVKEGATVEEIDAGGTITVEDGIILSENASLCFRLDLDEPESDFILSSGSFAHLGNIALTVTAGDYADCGTYNLAEDINEFTGTITVLDSDGKRSGELKVGENITVDGGTYSLELKKGDLLLEYAGSEYQDQQTISVIAGTKVNETYTPSYQPDTAGEYTVSLTAGDTVPASKLNGTITLKQGKTSVGSWTVKNGSVSGSGLLIDADPAKEMTVEVKLNAIPASSFTAGTVTVELNGTLLTKANNTDDVWQSLSEEYIYCPTETKVEEKLFSDEWVGFGDTADYRMLSLSAGGKLTFSIEAAGENTKGTLILYQASGDGSKLKTVKSLDLTATETGVQQTFTVDLAAGNYYCEVVPKSVTKKTAGCVDYEVTVSGTLNFKTENNSHDDTYDSAKTNMVSRTWEELSKGCSNWVGPDDTADTVLFTLNGPGCYDFELSGISKGAQVRLDLNKVVNGKMSSVKSITASGTTATLSGINIGAYEEEATYALTVTLLNGASGYDTDFTITASGAANDANIADDTYLTAQTLTAGETKTDWVGYGDIKDYYHLQVTESGEYTFEVRDIAKSAISVSILRGNMNSKGTYELTSVFSKKNLSTGIFSTGLSLAAGDYYICMEGGSIKDSGKDAAYTLSVSGEAWDSFTLTKDWQEVPVGETQTVKLTEYTVVKTDSAKGLNIWQDNGQNKKQAVKIQKQEVLLAPGTYYFEASSSVKVQTDPEDPSLLPYADAVLTDNNNWADATDLTKIGSWDDDRFEINDQWVGYGDSCDYYRIDVDGKTSGNWSFAYNGNNTANASMTLYAFDGKALKALKSGNSFTVSALNEGNYYLCVASKSATAASSAKNTAYSVAIKRDTMQELSLNGSVQLSKNEYAQIARSASIVTADFSGAFTLYKADGKGGMTKVTLSKDNMVQLEADTQYYVKSNGGKVSMTSTEAVFDDTNTLYTVQADGVTRLTTESLGKTIAAQVGLDHASDRFVFDTGTAETYGKDGYFMAFVNGASGTLQSSGAKYNLSLYQEVNGADKKLQTQALICTGSGVSGKTVSASLAEDATFVLEIATTDKGIGSSAGNFEIEAYIYEYDHTNDTFQEATVLDGESNFSGTVAKGGNAVDFFDIESLDDCKIKLNELADGTYGSVKVSFYDEEYQAIKGKNVTLDAKTTSCAVSGAKFAKIEAGSGCGYFTIGK